MKQRVSGELVSQSSLAAALAISDRRVRQLVDLGVVIREPNGGYDFPLNRRRYRLYVDRDMDSVADDIEKAAADADEALNQLRGEPDLSRRRALGLEVGFVIGQLDRAMRLANALAPEHARQLMETHTKMVVGGAAGTFLELCRLEIRDDEDESTGSPELLSS